MYAVFGWLHFIWPYGHCRLNGFGPGHSHAHYFCLSGRPDCLKSHSTLGNFCNFLTFLTLWWEALFSIFFYSVNFFQYDPNFRRVRTKSHPCETMTGKRKERFTELCKWNQVICNSNVAIYLASSIHHSLLQFSYWESSRSHYSRSILINVFNVLFRP